jgi:hypothetical protein
MSVEPIKLDLSVFEKLQILRDQLEKRQEEIVALEVEIRDKLQIQQTQRYLETLSPYYASNLISGLPSQEELQALEQRRTQLYDLVSNIEATIPVVMEMANGKGSAPVPGAPSTPAGPARKAKFDSFEDFSTNR